GAGINTLSYASSSAGVSINLGNGQAGGGDAQGDTWSNIANIIGSAFNDYLFGDGNNNVMQGGGGNDYLYGGAMTDTVVFSGALSDYLISYNAGTNTYTLVDQRSGSPDGTDTVTGFEIYRFSDGDRTSLPLGGGGTIMGTAGDDILTGTSGNDTIQGLAGND